LVTTIILVPQTMIRLILTGDHNLKDDRRTLKEPSTPKVREAEAAKAVVKHHVGREAFSLLACQPNARKCVVEALRSLI
jgi:hypothetical protein